ncbi:Pre-mRNA-splicing factor 18 [Intoshia linei]|uniref:Pre-mRNA-splicing factor 18 n=1 Tax=Intoshia linei TaxID=1819745 RepID=A0A177BBA9_9BILA|nr:Pre-mRNA-splicing factor 18 [Intoshia linei]
MDSSISNINKNLKNGYNQLHSLKRYKSTGDIRYHHVPQNYKCKPSKKINSVDMVFDLYKESTCTYDNSVDLNFEKYENMSLSSDSTYRNSDHSYTTKVQYTQFGLDKYEFNYEDEIDVDQDVDYESSETIFNDYTPGMSEYLTSLDMFNESDLNLSFDSLSLNLTNKSHTSNHNSNSLHFVHLIDKLNEIPEDIDNIKEIKKSIHNIESIIKKIPSNSDSYDNLEIMEKAVLKKKKCTIIYNFIKDYVEIDSYLNLALSCHDSGVFTDDESNDSKISSKKLDEIRDKMLVLLSISENAKNVGINISNWNEKITDLYLKINDLDTKTKKPISETYLPNILFRFEEQIKPPTLKIIKTSIESEENYFPSKPIFGNLIDSYLIHLNAYKYMEDLLKIVNEKTKELKKIKKSEYGAKTVRLSNLKRKAEENEIKEKSHGKYDNYKKDKNSTDQIIGKVPGPRELYLRLRERDEPIILFGETSRESYQRLLNLESKNSDNIGGYSNDMRKAMQQVSEQNMQTLLGTKPDDSFNESISVDKVTKNQFLIEAESVKISDIQKIISSPNINKVKRNEAIYLFCLYIIKLWDQSLIKQENLKQDTFTEEKDVRINRILFRQTFTYIEPLLRMLKNRNTPTDICESLFEIIFNCVNRDYIKAYDSYVQMAIGNAPWPIGVTMVGIHARKGREKINARNVAHVLNNEQQRKYIQALKRLMTKCQHFMPTDPSKSNEYHSTVQ